MDERNLVLSQFPVFDRLLVHVFCQIDLIIRVFFFFQKIKSFSASITQVCFYEVKKKKVPLFTITQFLLVFGCA